MLLARKLVCLSVYAYIDKLHLTIQFCVAILVNISFIGPLCSEVSLT